MLVGPDLSDRDDIRVPDLLVAFDCDRELVEKRRGYELELMGRPPDFVLGVASPTTGVNDYADKRLDYARYGILEYWRSYAADHMVEGVYEPVEVERLGESVWRGYSETPGLHVCWEHGRLRLFDPVTESYPRSHQEEVRAESEARRGTVAREDENRPAADPLPEGLRDGLAVCAQRVGDGGLAPFGIEFDGRNTVRSGFPSAA